MPSRNAGSPTRWISSPMRSRLVPYSSQKSQMRWISSLIVSNSSSAGTKGISTEESSAPCRMGALAPTRITAPFSLPGRSALGMALMQCMQRTQSRLLMLSCLPSQSMHLLGQLPQTSFWIFEPGRGVVRHFGLVDADLVLPRADDGEVGAGNGGDAVVGAGRALDLELVRETPAGAISSW